ncbi:WAT1-related protein, partial [Tanacetum coccineum]
INDILDFWTLPVVDHKLFYAGLKYTADTFAVAMGNIIPAMTFLIAWVCRSEKVNIKKIHSIGKIVGTPVIVGGATIMTVGAEALRVTTAALVVVKEAADMTDIQEEERTRRNLHASSLKKKLST